MALAHFVEIQEPSQPTQPKEQAATPAPGLDKTEIRLTTIYCGRLSQVHSPDYKNVKIGEIDLTKSHFAIYFSKEYGMDGWKLIAVMSEANTVDELRLTLLVHNGESDFEKYKMMHNELNFYLHELKNPDPVAYLSQIHCGSMSNIYSNIHINFIPSITKNNIIYYLLTQSKILNIFNDRNVSNLQQKYIQLTVDMLFDKALLIEDKYKISDYNIILNHLHQILELSINNDFKSDDQLTIVELAALLAKVDITTYCNIINYFAKIKHIKSKDFDRLLKFFYINKKLYQYSKRSTINNEI